MNQEDIIQFNNSLKEQLQCILQNMDPLFYHDYNFDSFLKNEIYIQYENIIQEEEFTTLYNKVIESLFLENNWINRSYLESDERFDHTTSNQEQIQYLKDVPQPVQRTPEWYDFRKKHLTGSNIWKVFSTPSAINQLIYEKLAPETGSFVKNNLSDSPLNWGHKYEPLSILFYEYFNDVVVEEFGCIPHKTIPFLAASPDGIVTSEKNNGRMLEIKNVVSREITKIPKMEYYIQMQTQMEVCDLPDCDFVETKFTEYESEYEFKKDKYNLKKGMIIVLIKNNDTFLYEYAPLFQNKESQLNDFIEETYAKYNISDPSIGKNGVRWFRNIYWKLDIYSCVYVPRNKLWFEKAILKMQEIWNKIQIEQTIEDSYLKYKSKKKKLPQEPNTPPIQVIHL